MFILKGHWIVYIRGTYIYVRLLVGAISIVTLNIVIRVLLALITLILTDL